MFCPKCGASLPDGAGFCGSCGAQLGQTNQQPAAAAAVATTAMKAGGPNKKIIIGAGVVAVIVVIAIIVGIVSCASGFKGAKTPSDFCVSLNKSMEKVIKDGFSENSAKKFAKDLINMMPPGYVDAYCKSNNISKDTLDKQIESATGSLGSLGPSLSPYLKSLDIKWTFSATKELSSSTISSINAQFNKVGYTKYATSGYYLSMDLSMTAKEAIPAANLKAGQTRSQTGMSTGMYVIQVDGKWYLFSSM